MPSIGKDLANIRTSQGLTLQDIQATIKIPMATLEKIENGTIFEDLEYGKTYVRSFIRSYGRALKIDDEVMINGLNQQETGNYNQLLWNHYELGRESPSFKKFAFDDLETSDEVDDDQNQNEPDSTPANESGKDNSKPDLSTKTEESKPKNPKKIKTPASPSTPSTPSTPSKNVDWADMGLKFTETKKTTPIWLFVTLILIVVIFVIGYFIYANDLFNFSDTSINEPETSVITPTTPNTGDSLLNLDESEEMNVTTSPQVNELDEILYITVYAANERLEPVRIWSDIKPRMDPYWIEQGIAMNFDFRDTVRIRGQYEDMLIFKNGHAIDDILETNFNSQENYIELTRDYFSTDPKWVSSQPFQLPEDVAPPDSVMLRPTF